MSTSPSLPELLDRFRSRLPGMIRRHGLDLLTYESVHDLSQEIELQVLKGAERFEYQGDESFLGFLATVARRVVINRRKFWKARKRDAHNVLRISTGSHSEEFRTVDPAAPFPTPSSLAARKEIYVRVLKATALLLEKDRQVLTWMSEGRSIDETAGFLDCDYNAAAKARYRAVSRLKKAYKIVCNSENGDEEPGVSAQGC